VVHALLDNSGTPMVTEGASRQTIQRHEVVDALRGFALTGVCLVNLSSLSLYEFLDPAAKDVLATSGFDAIAGRAVEWLVNVKFITIFSLLFGLGFCLQLQRTPSNDNGSLRYLRRILALMVMGGIHAWFVWWGDILFTYAVVALLMLAFRNVSDRALLILGIAIALMPPLIAPYVREILPERAEQMVLYEQSLEGFSSGNWSETLSSNIALSNWARISNWALVCFVLGRFLLGFWAGRKGLMLISAQNFPVIRRIFFWALGTGAATTALAHFQPSILASWPATGSEPVRTLLRMALRVGPLAIGIAYAAGFVLLFYRPAWARRLSVFAPLGRMALTNYVTQSFMGIAMFYGVGFGVGPRFGMIGILGACVFMITLQMWWSRKWLGYFAHGPLEWAWRWITYGRRPPFRMERIHTPSV
jgi:uncharacterized protein